MEGLSAEPALQRYHLLPGVREDLLAKLGRLEEAATRFHQTTGLIRNERERTWLLARASTCRQRHALSEAAGSSRQTTTRSIRSSAD